MDNAFYPPAGFYFKLVFSGISNEIDNAFQEVSGFSISNKPLDIEEDGVNRYKHTVPTSAKFDNLILKRGYTAQNSELSRWCEATLSSNFSEPINTRSFLIHLIDETGQPLESWFFENAWPTKWSISSFNASEKSITIETLEFSYSTFKRIS